MEKYDRKRNGAIDFIKVISITCIVLLHFQQFTGSAYNQINFFGGGYDFSLFVELLFIISGYFSLDYIERLRESCDYVEMMVKRGRRLLGPAIPCTLFYAMVMLIYRVIEGNWFYDEPLSITCLLASLFGIQFAWFIPPGERAGVILGCNPPTWFIDSLLLCVLFMTLLVYITNKTQINLFWSFSFIVLVGIYGYKLGMDFPLLNWASCRGYYSFFSGIILAEYDKKISDYKYGRVLKYVTICILMNCGCILYTNGWGITRFTFSFFLFPSLILLSNTCIIRKCFSNKVWTFLSAVSYEVYLCHFSFLLIFIVLRNQGYIDNEFANSSYLCMALYTIFVWIISIGIYNMNENNWIRKIIAKINQFNFGP